MEEHIQRDLSADLGGRSPTAGSWWLPVAAWHGHRNHHPLNPPGDGDGNTHSHQSRLGFLVKVRNSGITFWASAGGYWHFSPNFTPPLSQLHPLLSPESLSLHTPFSDSRLCPIIALSSVAVLALASAGDLKSVTENWKANPKQLGFIITLISKWKVNLKPHFSYLKAGQKEPFWLFKNTFWVNEFVDINKLAFLMEKALNSFKTHIHRWFIYHERDLTKRNLPNSKTGFLQTALNGCSLILSSQISAMSSEAFSWKVYPRRLCLSPQPLSPDTTSRKRQKRQQGCFPPEDVFLWDFSAKKVILFTLERK